VTNEWPRSFLGKVTLFVVEWVVFILLITGISWTLCQVVLHILRLGVTS